MAQNFVNPTTQSGLREDLADFVREISYNTTQFVTRAGDSKATALTHSWMTQALRAGASNTRAGGYTPSFAAGDITVRVKRNNQVQFLASPFSTEDSLQWIDKAQYGTMDEFDIQKNLKQKEVALDLDWNAINQTTQTRDDDAGTAGQMDGALAWATGTRAINAQSGPLTEDLYNNLAQVIAETSGEMATEAFVNGKQKRAITNWTTGIRRLAEQKTYVNSVGAYDGDWGTQNIIWDLQIPAGSLLLCKMEYVKIAYGVPMKTVELGRVGDQRQGYIKCEATLEVQNPNTVGKLTNIA